MSFNKFENIFKQLYFNVKKGFMNLNTKKNRTKL